MNMRGITAYELIRALKADSAALEAEIRTLEKAVGTPQKLARVQHADSGRHLKLLHELDALYLQRSRIRDSLQITEAKYKELNE